MPSNSTRNIWTIGHSTHALEDFVELLQQFQIRNLLDIRRYPGSRRHPHFNQEALEISMPERGIAYRHMEELGGRRKPRPDSVNHIWKHPSFRAYADYMETEAFIEAASQLEVLAEQQKTAIMCSEAVWWSCHRAMVSDYLKSRDWQVFHIMGSSDPKLHPYTSPARIEHGHLTYKVSQS